MPSSNAQAMGLFLAQRRQEPDASGCRAIAPKIKRFGLESVSEHYRLTPRTLAPA